MLERVEDVDFEQLLIRDANFNRPANQRQIAALEIPNEATYMPAGQCSRYQDLTSGTSITRRVRPERKLNGRGAHISAMPFAVLSE